MSCLRDSAMHIDTAPITSNSVTYGSNFPPLRRISSDWQPERDILQHGGLHPRDVRKEFEELNDMRGCLSTSKKPRESSHSHYFRSQTENRSGLRPPADPIATTNETVLVDKTTSSIFDAYLVHVNIAKNVNDFHRQQIVYSSARKVYTVIVREGRVGYPGQGRRTLESTDRKKAIAKFFRLFQDKTGKGWYQRHVLPGREGSFFFVELDYQKATPHQSELPNYTRVDEFVNDEIGDLMGVALQVGPFQDQKLGEKLYARSHPSYFSIPHKHISSWSNFLAFKTLEAIRKHLESGSDINWRAILRASSRYRSQIPFFCQLNRPTVVSSYHTVFVELRFLHSLWPRQETADMLTEISLRGSLQIQVWRKYAHPLYQGYLSLGHGFRRLTDGSTLEFRELKTFLERSCHRSHGLSLELQDIYEIFMKANVSNPYKDWIQSKKDSPDRCGEERLLLWHGTPLDSVLGILDVGLQIRRRGSNFTGSMFGEGIYFADASSKSANFCKQGEWDGEAVLFLCEADVGERRIKSLTSMKEAHDVISQSDGQFRCVQGVGRFSPKSWKKVEWKTSGLPNNDEGVIFMPDTSHPYEYTGSGGCLGFNEYVIYSTSHVTLRYLFRVKVKTRRS